MKEYTTQLLAAVPEITTVINNINAKMASVAIGDYEKVFHGSGFIYDTIGKYKFRVSANSFFQTNTTAGRKAYMVQLLSLQDFREMKLFMTFSQVQVQFQYLLAVMQKGLWL